MKKLNFFSIFGILFISISLISDQFDIFPDFFEGFSIGIGCVFVLFGAIAQKYDITKFSIFKKNIIKK